MNLDECRIQEELMQRGEGAASTSLNILIVNQSLPVFPGLGGIEYLNTTNLTRLAGTVGLAAMVHTEDDLAKSQVFRDRGVKLYLWRSPHIAQQPKPSHTVLKRAHRLLVSISYLTKSWLFGVPEDTLITDLGFRNLSSSLREALSEQHWQVLIVIQSSMAAAIEYLPKQPISVLVMHDIRSRVYERQAQVAGSWWQKIHLRHQARLYYDYEKGYLKKYNLVVALSKVDAEWIRANYCPRELAVVPIPVDTSYFCAYPEPREVPNRIMFTGLMNHPPNSDAAIFFARRVFPVIRKVLPSAEFYIVGKDPTDLVKALNKIEGVTVTGTVPDTRPYLAEASVIVVPLRFGSGVRQKILEAWGMEKFIISTSLGAEGLQFENGVHLVIADDAETMAKTVIHALTDDNYRRQVSRAGRMVAQAFHDPQQVVTTYYRSIETVGRKLQHSCSAPMHVVADMRWMIPGRAGGLENLARSFVAELLELDQYNSYTLLLPVSCRFDFDLRGRRNFRILCRDSARNMARRLVRRGIRSLHFSFRLDHWESKEVVALRELRAMDGEIAFSFPGYIHPDLLPLRQVLVVPDIQHEYLPEFFTTEALDERNRVYGDSIRRADHICAISEFTRQSLMEKHGLAPERVTTTPLAADPIFKRDQDLDRDLRVLQKYELPENYLFFPAHTWHHKNHLASIEAMRILRDKHNLLPLLVCTGGPREAQGTIEQRIAQYGLQRQIVFLGYCPQEDLPSLYRRAGCLLFPSLFEGFGMPVLEAMACGCPVACSNVTSLPEIAGNAALLVSPHDHEGLANAVAQLLQDCDLRCELIRRGEQQASKFSWRKYTLQTIAVLHRVHMNIREYRG